jgi:hypothetical protein
MNKKITFVSHQLYNNENKALPPKPGKKQVPKWFVSANKYWKEEGKEEVLRHQWGAEILGFKSCPALLDMFLNGYYLTTPCDILFYKDPQSNTLMAKTEPGYESFIGSREPMNGFAVPYGYEEHHFHWYPNWGVRLEKGYSAIFISPINRYDLPFISTAGIIDSDMLEIPGLVPFFLREGFSGVLPAGTPYVQIIPFKRENWKMDLEYPEEQKMKEIKDTASNILRTSENGQYKKHLWKKKVYE